MKLYEIESSEIESRVIGDTKDGLKPYMKTIKWALDNNKQIYRGSATLDFESNNYYELFDEYYDPEKNGFKTTTYKQLKPVDGEIWFEGSAIFLPAKQVYNWKSFQEWMNDIK